MKKIILLIAVIIVATTTAQAQLFKKKDRTVETEYAQGTVPVVNGKVSFEATIPAEGLTAAQVQDKVNEWIAARFVKPTVISAKRYDENPNIPIVKGEEYIVFRNTFLVQSRARIYYYLTLTPGDGYCKFNMTRITYWYDDEDDNGGIKMKAEEWITDDNAFNDKGGLKKFEGKFRRKTIDLKDALINELTKKLNSK
ncbi:MAG: DUF4468 domain-containing protein [Bacteroidaceae bacterium]|jgi:hypothetical protein|nr:DUF4468 domain-containing protein [Bacteroidaceae bacterium]